MLPPRLREIKERLQKRATRNKAQEELLNELKQLDEMVTKGDRLLENVTKQFSGPSDRCSCCGAVL